MVSVEGRAKRSVDSECLFDVFAKFKVSTKGFFGPMRFEGLQSGLSLGLLSRSKSWLQSWSGHVSSWLMDSSNETPITLNGFLLALTKCLALNSRTSGAFQKGPSGLRLAFEISSGSGLCGCSVFHLQIVLLSALH